MRRRWEKSRARAVGGSAAARFDASVLARFTTTFLAPLVAPRVTPFVTRFLARELAPFVSGDVLRTVIG